MYQVSSIKSIFGVAVQSLRSPATRSMRRRSLSPSRRHSLEEDIVRDAVAQLLGRGAIWPRSGYVECRNRQNRSLCRLNMLATTQRDFLGKYPAVFHFVDDKNLPFGKSYRVGLLDIAPFPLCRTKPMARSLAPGRWGPAAATSSAGPPGILRGGARDIYFTRYTISSRDSYKDFLEHYSSSRYTITLSLEPK